MKRMYIDLKPCPLCGGIAVLKMGADEVGAECAKCGANIKMKSTRGGRRKYGELEEVARRWNRRFWGE